MFNKERQDCVIGLLRDRDRVTGAYAGSYSRRDVCCYSASTLNMRKNPPPAAACVSELRYFVNARKARVKCQKKKKMLIFFPTLFKDSVHPFAYISSFPRPSLLSCNPSITTVSTCERLALIPTLPFNDRPYMETITHETHCITLDIDQAQCARVCVCVC